MRAGLVSRPADWPWSSAVAHLRGRDDKLVKVGPLRAIVPDWKAFHDGGVSEHDLEKLRRHARTGRPLGDETFLGRLERVVGRALKPQKRGPNKV